MDDRALVVPSRPASHLLGGTAVGAGVILWKVIPSFMAVFADRAASLSVWTRWFLAIPPWAWPLAGCGFAAMLWWKDRALSAESAKRINLAAIVALVGVGFFALIAMLLPLLTGG